MTADGVYVLECDVRETALGRVLRIQLERYDGEPMGWEAIHAAFVSRYPGRWAVQLFPPADRLLNGAHKYHLYVLADYPAGLDLSVDAPAGTTDPIGRLLERHRTEPTLVPTDDPPESA